MPADETTIRLSISISAINHAELKEIADRKRVSLAWVVRDAVEHYLESQAPLFSRRTAGSID
jgi:predicted transcriptional regulator